MRFNDVKISIESDRVSLGAKLRWNLSGKGIVSFPAKRKMRLVFPIESEKKGLAVSCIDKIFASCEVSNINHIVTVLFIYF